MLTAATTIAATFAMRIFDTGDEAEKAKPKMDRLLQTIQRLNVERGKIAIADINEGETLLAKREAAIRDAENRVRAAERAAGNVASRKSAAQELRDQRMDDAMGVASLGNFGALRATADGTLAELKTAREELQKLRFGDGTEDNPGVAEIKQALLNARNRNARVTDYELTNPKGNNASSRGSSARSPVDSASAKALDSFTTALARVQDRTASLSVELRGLNENIPDFLMDEARIRADAFATAQKEGAKWTDEQRTAWSQATEELVGMSNQLAYAKERSRELAQAIANVPPLKLDGLELVKRLPTDAQMEADLKRIAGMHESTAKRVSESWEGAANNALGAMEDLVRGIEGGGFLRVLSGALNIFTSLGSLGVFGSKIKTNLAGARANGGPVTAGRSYLVGEHRPEIFTPNRNGYILPDANAAAYGGGATRVEVVPSPYFDARVTQISGNVAAPMSMRAAEGGASIAQQRATASARRRMPSRF